MYGWILLGALGLLLFYKLHKRSLKKQLIKLKENYNEEKNISRPAGREAPSRSSGYRGTAISDDKRESGTKRDDEPEREIVLPPTTDIRVNDSERKSVESNGSNKKSKKRFSIRRRR